MQCADDARARNGAVNADAGERIGEVSLSHTATCRHFFCHSCDIYPLHRKRLDPDHYGVNMNLLEGADRRGIPVRATIGAAMA